MADLPASSLSTSHSDDAFFDALDSIPSHPPPHIPTLSSSTLRRRPRRAKAVTQPDPTSSALSSSTITAVEEPLKPDLSEVTSAPPPPPPPPLAPPKPEPSEATSDAFPSPPSPLVAAEAAPAASGLLESLAGLVIKGVDFQVGALISCLTFPIWLLYWWFVFVTDPLGAARRASAWARGVAERAAVAVSARLGGGEGVGRVVSRLAWGSLWAAYVCVLLCGLLAMAFLAGGLLVGRLVEKPVQVTESLNFDYTKPSPAAFVPVRPLVPPNQQMQLEVWLTLPESDYNRRLGVFQVRAEFLSADGKVISSLTQPCMLQFKSAHMHFVETFLRSVSLLSGYSSESQVIKLKLRGITEGLEPTIGIRIVLEQRAEFSPGAGIPEIYAASIKLESELPLLKRILWNWRWTLFVWSSMGFFVFELLFALVCCRPCILPRSGHNVGAP